MSNTRKRKPQPPKPKKKCLGGCGKERQHTFFYKVSSPMFPDGMINICRDCVRATVDIEDMESVIGFLRQIDKPFKEDSWNSAVKSGKYPLGEYIRKVNSLHQLSEKNFDNSDGMEGIGKTVDLQSAKMPDKVETVTGTIEYSDELVNKWGIGYKKHEYLQMEKFYVDMKETHEIITSIHADQLKQLAYLSIERDRLRQSGEWGDYERVSKTMELMLKSAGFRAIDRKSGAEATGIFSFSQVWAEIEREGFVEPRMIDYPKDDIDHMLLYYIQFAQRLVGKSVSTAPPTDWRDETFEDIEYAEFEEIEELEEVDEDGE